MNRTERIARLREKVFAPKHHTPEWSYLYYKGYLEGCRKTFAMVEKYAWAINYMLSNVTPAIGEDELILGRSAHRQLTEEESAEWGLMQKFETPTLNVSNYAHFAIDNEYILRKGINGIKEDIDGYINRLDPAKSEDLEKNAFYSACKISLDGVIKYAENYVFALIKAAEDCGDPKRKSELLRLAGIFRNVPAKPAANFYEALQTVWIILVCVAVQPSGLVQLGRPDRYLIKYYRQDISNGDLTETEAQELIDCVCVMYNEIVGSGLACGFMIGGRDENGVDTTNELTYLFMRSISNTAMIYPGIGLCYNGDTPQDLLDLAVKTLGEGHSHPALFNDDIIQKGLRHYGLSPEEACSYINSTCVEITPVAASGVWVACPYNNLVQYLLDIIGIKKEASEPTGFENIEQLKQAYYRYLKERIRTNFIDSNRSMIQHPRTFAQPLLSCFMKDCLEKGMDVEWGGAKYNWIMPSFVGLANLTDSLLAIDDLIFKTKRLTFKELADILEKNFEGHEDIRAYILNKVKRYGNDDETADDLIIELSRKIAELCEGYENCRGGRLVPSLFCWIQHDRLGTQTMASPDGRLTGFPLGDGSGPVQGAEKNGPTASILSSTKWEHHKFIGGIAVNMKFTKKFFTGESREKLTVLIKTFMKRGGFELQINVVDKETLEKARQTPELYRDLIVRIGGYSDYFTRLSKSMQAEIIQRTEHGI